MPGSTANYQIPYPLGTEKPTIASDMAAIAARVDQIVNGVPIGASLTWGYGAAQIPTWALLQYGQAVSRTTYPKLHTLANQASYPHGSGDGSTTFNIADKRGRVSAGKDDMGGTAAGRITAALSGAAGTVLGAVVGSEGITLATAGMPSHNHGGSTGNISADHSHAAWSAGRDTAHNHADNGHYHNPGISATTQDGWIGDDPSGYYSGGNGAPIGPHYGGNWYNSNWGYISCSGETYDHGHHTDTGGIDTNHTHGIYAEGGGGAHLNTQPTIIVQKIVRAI
jgi:microcystin-dependent protein